MPKVDMTKYTPMELRVACELPPGISKTVAIRQLRDRITNDDLFAVRVAEDIPRLVRAKKVRIEPI